VPITSNYREHRASVARHARSSGLTIGTIVTVHWMPFWAPEKAWLSGARAVAYFKFVSTMH